MAVLGGSERQATNLLREWERFGVSLTAGQVRHLRSAGEALLLMSEAGNAYGTIRLRHLQSLVRGCEEQLAPVEDPLRTRFGLNRWLAKSREEAYSDWLAWVLQEFRAGGLVGRLLFGDGTPESKLLSKAPAYSVDREVWVPEGHKGRAGRLDCVLRFDDAVVVLELKRSDAELADTAKHEGYMKWLDGRHERFKRGLLIAASTENHESYDGFVLLQWKTLCQRARRLACELRAGNRLSFVATLCAFIGAIEQNLLGFPHVGDLATHQEINGQDLERVIAYLADYHGSEGNEPSSANR
jgi:hypothetical protein